MPEDRKDREAEFNNLARLFAMNWCQMVLTTDTDEEWLNGANDALIFNHNLYTSKLRELYKEMGYAGQTE